MNNQNNQNFFTIKLQEDELYHSDKQKMMAERLKNWHELFYMRFDSSFTKEENFQWLYRSFGDMIDFESCVQISDFHDEIFKNIRLTDCEKENSFKYFVNALQYEKLYLERK